MQESFGPQDTWERVGGRAAQLIVRNIKTWGGMGKELCCNLCFKNCWSFIRVEVGINGEVQAELIMQFYLSWSWKNQHCSLFPHKCSRGQNPVTFLTQIILAVIILKWKLYQRLEILPGKELPRETRRTHIRLQQSIEFRASFFFPDGRFFMWQHLIQFDRGEPQPGWMLTCLGLQISWSSWSGTWRKGAGLQGPRQGLSSIVTKWKGGGAGTLQCAAET